MNSLNARTFLALLVAIGIILSIGAVRAGPGHDHGAPVPTVSTETAPRAEASSQDFELVLVVHEGQLIIHLDEFRSNAPVSEAEIQIDTPSGQLTPAASAEGVYTASAPFLSKPGAYDFAITVSALGTIDILAATLRIPQEGDASGDGHQHDHQHGHESGHQHEAGHQHDGHEDGHQHQGGQQQSWLIDSALASELRSQVGESGISILLVLAAGFVAGMIVARLIWRRRAAAAAVVAVLAGALLLPIKPALADTAAADYAPSPGISEPGQNATGKSGPPDMARRLPDGTVFVPKPTQRILGVRTVMTKEGKHHRGVELPGRIIPSPNASGLVQASVGGRLSPPEGGFKPLGTRVKAGDVLAYVHPPLALADATEQQLWARELDQQISIVERKVARLSAIKEVIAKSQLQDAELELAGLKKRRAGLNNVKREPEALVAPVDGVIASASAVAGQMAEPNAVIYQIVDPQVLWIEALSFRAHKLNGKAKARLSDGRTVELEHAGTGLTGSNQAVPIHFAIKGDVADLSAGQFVTVVAEVPDNRSGVALPREAVVRGANGQSIVYEHVSAERFAAVEVRVEPLDGARVLAVAGVVPGYRIVTQGAELLGQIR